MVGFALTRRRTGSSRSAPAAAGLQHRSKARRRRSRTTTSCADDATRGLLNHDSDRAVRDGPRMVRCAPEAASHAGWNALRKVKDVAWVVVALDPYKVRKVDSVIG